MSSTTVTMVRIYLHEGDKHVKQVLAWLHDEAGVRGVTVFRGVEGYGVHGKPRSSALLDLSLDLPVVVEFFDLPDRARTAIAGLEQQVAAYHVVHWQAEANVPVRASFAGSRHRA